MGETLAKNTRLFPTTRKSRDLWGNLLVLRHFAVATSERRLVGVEVVLGEEREVLRTRTDRVLDEVHDLLLRERLAALSLGRVSQIEERLICRSGSVHVDVLVEDALFFFFFYGLLFFALITRFSAKGYRSRFSAVPALSPQNIRGGFRREENVHLRLSPPSPVRA